MGDVPHPLHTARGGGQGASPCGLMSGSRTSVPRETTGIETLQGKKTLPWIPSPAALCPVPRFPAPSHPTSRDLADPVQLRLALHGHPLQGGQVKHCTAPDVIIVMPAPVKIVVRELEVGVREGGQARGAGLSVPRTDEPQARPELRTLNPGWTPHPPFFYLQGRPNARTQLNLAHLQVQSHPRKTTSIIEPCPPRPAHRLTCPLQAGSPPSRRSSASSAPLRDLDGSDQSRTSSAHGSRALIHFSTIQGWGQKR